MPRGPGRDQNVPMERLVRLIAVLANAERGCPVDQLMRAVVPEDGDTPEARRKKLNRDVEALNQLGYDIRNVAPPGVEAVYRMRARDNRLQVHLSAEQRGELLRAAFAAGLDGVEGHLGSGADTSSTRAGSPDQQLDLVQRGTTRHCLVRFEYKGLARVVHPARLHSGPSGWYLTGREEAQHVVKEFVVSRMSDVTLGVPGSAEPVEQSGRPSLDPLSWLEDSPSQVVLEVAPDQRLLVEHLLGPAGAADETGGMLRLRYDVTHRAMFRLRLYELGARVRLLSPEDFRAEMVAELAAVAGVAR